MIPRRIALFGTGSCLLCGCAGALHRLPAINEAHLGLAQAEIASAARLERRQVSDEEAVAALRRVRARLLSPAATVCQEIGAGVCKWEFRVRMAEPSPNAYATGDGTIVVYRGIVDYARNDDELAFVLAHEIGHHAANHLRRTRQNAAVGALIGAILLGGIAAVAGAHAGGGPLAQSITRDATEIGLHAGAAIGRVSFSKEQEREADYVAAVILHRAGFDLQKARGFLVTLAQMSGRRETGLLDTHPAGPERLAAYDRAVAEILQNRGALPSRA